MTARPRATRVALPEEHLLRDVPADYADAFAVPARPDDRRTAEQWMRSGLEGSPAALRGLVLVAHRQVLRLRLGPTSSPGHVLGWRVVHAEPDAIALEAAGPLLRGRIVGRRVGSRVTLTTTVAFVRPGAGRALWAVVGPVHRRVAPALLQRAAAAEPAPRSEPAV